ncbi:hypothetical protein TNCT_680851 [Trichonephila clavata]|uniref:Uncharacterized protein n=1 Tax=Trichonephila clavata TaxID=2740835 RepID=A0A8X6GQI4_TRICU|nr:hypothetical protein TNCT_680851 [Trichonephila clavata]
MGVPRTDWTEIKHRNSSPNRNYIKRRLWSQDLMIVKLNHSLQLLESSRKNIKSEKYHQKIDKSNPKLRHLCSTLVNRIGPIIRNETARPHILPMTAQKLNELGLLTDRRLLF